MYTFIYGWDNGGQGIAYFKYSNITVQQIAVTGKPIKYQSCLDECFELLTHETTTVLYDSYTDLIFTVLIIFLLLSVQYKTVPRNTIVTSIYK